MRITLVGPVYPYRGGIAHYTTLLAQTLRDAQHALQMISFRRQYPAFLYPGETDRDTSQQPLKVAAEYLLDPLYPWTWFQAANTIARANPDLVIIMWWTTFWGPAYAVLSRLLRARGVRVLYLIHNVLPHEPRLWDRLLARLAMAPARQYIVQAEREAQRLRILLPKAKIIMSPHPVYDMFAGQTIPKERARQTLALAPDVPVLLFFGIVRPYKGLRYLLEALHLLRQDGQAPQLVIAGEFWEPESEYAALIDQWGLAQQVQIHNRYIANEDIPTFFGAADIFVAPYVDGTQSGSAKLALGFGLPMVLTRCVVDETLAKSSAVWVAEEQNAASLAQALNEALAGDPTPRRLPEGNWRQVAAVIESLVD